MASDGKVSDLPDKMGDSKKRFGSASLQGGTPRQATTTLDQFGSTWIIVWWTIWGKMHVLRENTIFVEKIGSRYILRTFLCFRFPRTSGQRIKCAISRSESSGSMRSGPILPPFSQLCIGKNLLAIAFATFQPAAKVPGAVKDLGPSFVRIGASGYFTQSDFWGWKCIKACLLLHSFTHCHFVMFRSCFGHLWTPFE